MTVATITSTIKSSETLGSYDLLGSLPVEGQILAILAFMPLFALIIVMMVELIRGIFSDEGDTLIVTSLFIDVVIKLSLGLTGIFALYGILN